MSKKQKASKEMAIATDGAIINPLTPAEEKKLEHREAIIQKHKQGFMKAAEALLEIRDLRLWRGGYKSFDEYCQKKWKFGDRWARKLFTASEITKQISGSELSSGLESVENKALNLPSSANQVLPLAKVDGVDERKRIWDSATRRAETKGGRNKRPTARDVENEIKRSKHQRVVVNAQNPLMSAYTTRRDELPPKEAETEAAFNPVLPGDKSLGEVCFDAWEASMGRITGMRPNVFSGVSAANREAWEDAAKAVVAEHQSRVNADLKTIGKSLEVEK